MSIYKQLMGLVVITAVALLVTIVVLRPSSSLPKLLHDVAVEPPQPLGKVTLIDHNRQTVSLERFKQKWTFLFVGFTSCTHICMPALAQLALLKKAIIKESGVDPKADKAPDFVFVSVDPKRDTPERLAKYMLNFDPEFIGMTGDKKAVLALEKRLKAFHRVREDKRKPQGYDIDHSGEIYLINPLGQLVAKFHPPLDFGKVIKQFSLFVSHFKTTSKS